MKATVSTLLASLIVLAPSTFAEKLAGRGVYYQDSSVGCPLAGIGERGPKSCLRLALLDAHSTVEIDQVAKKIIIANDFDYKSTTPIVDVALPASLTSKSIGEFGGVVHVKVEKKHQKLTIVRHAHMSAMRDFTGTPVVDEYEIVLKTSKAEEILADPKSGIEQVKQKSTSSNFVQLRPYPAEAAKTGGDQVMLIDSRVGIGLETVNKGIVRLRFSTKKTEQKPQTVADVLKDGHWVLRVESLTSLIPQTDLKEDLFLYGLDGRAELAGLMKGLKKGGMIQLSANGNDGTLAFDGKEIKVTNVAEIVRRYMEFNSLGIAFRADLQSALKKL